MYILLHGAKKNVGDFLIFERARRLAEHYLEGPFLAFYRDEPLEQHLDQVNRAGAVILCGGPGYHSDFYPRVYSLTSPISSIEVPILPLGLGWGGHPMNAPERFQFSAESLEALREMAQRVPHIGCRDDLSLQVLQRAGLNSAQMVGCPAWYDIPSIGKPFTPPQEIRKVVFTPPQNRRLRGQAILLMRQIKRLFPRAERYCVFHRGWEMDRYSTDRLDVLANQVVRLAALSMGFKPINAAYDVDRVEFYRECDLHIGYRVHAQVFFLSIRKPSILIHTDGRGVGLSRTFDLPDCSAYDDDVVGSVVRRTRQELDDGFSRFHAACSKIDSTYDSMVELLQSVS